MQVLSGADICVKDQAASSGRLRLKCDGTRAETRFHLSRETDESI